MPRSKELELVLVAAEDILAGKPVKDLDERIENMMSSEFIDSNSFYFGDVLHTQGGQFLAVLEAENDILNGISPFDAYRVINLNPNFNYKELREDIHRFIKEEVYKLRKE